MQKDALLWLILGTFIFYCYFLCFFRGRAFVAVKDLIFRYFNLRKEHPIIHMQYVHFKFKQELSLYKHAL